MSEYLPVYFIAKTHMLISFLNNNPVGVKYK